MAQHASHGDHAHGHGRGHAALAHEGHAHRPPVQLGIINVMDRQPI